MILFQSNREQGQGQHGLYVCISRYISIRSVDSAHFMSLCTQHNSCSAVPSLKEPRKIPLTSGPRHCSADRPPPWTATRYILLARKSNNCQGLCHHTNFVYMMIGKRLKKLIAVRLVIPYRRLTCRPQAVRHRKVRIWLWQCSRLKVTSVKRSCRCDSSVNTSVTREEIS